MSIVEGVARRTDGRTTSTAARPGRVAGALPLASLCLAALTAATAVSLCRVFPDWAYLRPMLVVAIGVHAVATLLRVARAPLWAALPVMTAVLFELLAFVYYRDTLNGPFPSGRTLSFIRIDVRLVLEQFPSAVAPVPSHGTFAVACGLVLGLCAIFSDTFAFRAFGRVEALVPTCVLFVFTSALGTDRHRVAVATLWVAVALLTIAVLRFSQAHDTATWMGSRRLTLAAAFPPIAATVGLAALAAGAVATHLPGAGREAILKTHGHGSTITQVLSPLVDIRARIRQQSDQEWFTVASSDGPHYWRMTALTTFDGNQWLPASEELVARGDLSDRLPGTRSDQVITITGMRGHLVPAAFLPAKVSGGSIRWAAGSETLVQTGDELAANQTITISSRVPQLTPVRLRQATSAGVAADYKQLPLDLSDSVRATAVAVSAGASSNYDKAIALQSWFRDNFTYDLNVPSGESDDAISAFLRERRGFCQQFSVAFAVMARSLGIPARVAVGFTQGDLGSDGLYHVYGRHAHAWPEVWFDGFGWVAFEPTPGRGNPDTSGYTGVAPAQDDTRGGGNGGQPSAVSTPNTASTVPGKPAEGPGGTPTIPVGERTTVPVRKGAGRAGGIGSSVMALVLIGLLLLVVLWMLLAPRVVAALARRRAHSAPERVVAAWHRTCNALSLAGAPPVGGATPLEYAATAERAAGLPEQSVRELARQVTRVVYSPLGVGEADAAACESLEHDLDSMCRARTPLSLRLQALLDPRMMRRRATG